MGNAVDGDASVTPLFRFAALIALAGGLGVAGMFLCDAIIGSTHNVAAALISIIAGGVIAILTLIVGSDKMFRK